MSPQRHRRRTLVSWLEFLASPSIPPMFDWLKRQASEILQRRSFDSNMKAVMAAPAAVQAAIAAATIPEIDAILSIEPLSARQMALSSKLQVATAKRRIAVANGSSQEADTRWTPAALLESWCTAALTDKALFIHVNDTLIGWAATLPISTPIPPQKMKD